MLVDKIYRSIEIDRMPITMIKVDPTTIKNNEDIMNFILDQKDDKKLRALLCVTLIRKSNNVVSKGIYVLKLNDVIEYVVDNNDKDEGSTGKSKKDSTKSSIKKQPKNKRKCSYCGMFGHNKTSCQTLSCPLQRVLVLLEYYYFYCLCWT